MIRILNCQGTELEKIKLTEKTSIEELAMRVSDRLIHRPMLAKVDGKEHSLTSMIEDSNEEITVQLVDGSTQSGNLVYQHTLSMVFLKAVRNVLGDVPVHILNPLNKGVFIRINTGEPLLKQQVDTISGLMAEYIRRDIPIEQKLHDKAEAISMLENMDYQDKADLLKQAEDVKHVRFFYMGDYCNTFYGIMAPSAGYVDKFQLMKYRDGILLRMPYTDNPSELPEYRDDVKLYDAFVRVEKWNELLGISYLADLNAKIAAGGTRDMVLLSEALHEKRIAEIADMINESGKRIVLIAGPSSSGKTSFANRLCVQLRVAGVEPLYMGTDDYFKNREETPLGSDGKPDFENLSAMDIELFNNNMNDLIAGKEVDLPEFDFMTGEKVFGKRITKLNEGQVLVIEGIHALNEAMTPYIDKGDKFKIYISPLTQLNVDVHNRISTTDARMLRRMVRDSQFRGRSAEVTIADWSKVRAGEDLNIFPYNGEADVLFNSVMIYELALLKKYAQPLLEAVKEDSPQYAEAQRLVEFLRYFRPLEDEKYIPNNSIIREFIGGSILLNE